MQKDLKRTNVIRRFHAVEYFSATRAIGIPLAPVHNSSDVATFTLAASIVKMRLTFLMSIATIATLMQFSFNSQVECNLCSTHVPTTYRALKHHLDKAHKHAVAANLGVGHKNYIAPNPSMPFCLHCHLYVDDEKTLKSHLQTDIHLHNASKLGAQEMMPKDGEDQEDYGGGAEDPSPIGPLLPCPEAASYASSSGAATASGGAGGGSGGSSGSSGSLAEDWLGRGDRIAYGPAGTLPGEVYVAPFNTDLWDKDLAKASTNHLNYSRYRVVRVEGSGPQKV